MKKIQIALACLLAALLAGCAAKPQGRVIRFRYWGDLKEMAIIHRLIAEFEKANPGVTVKDEMKPAPGQTYTDSLLTEFAAGTAPDVIFLTADIMDSLAHAGVLQDLSPFLQKDKDLKESEFYPSIIRRFTIDGKLLVLPRDIAPFACVYYNKNLFDAAHLPYPKDDWTVEQMRQDAIKLTKRDADGQVTQWGFAEDWPILETWMLDFGGKVVDDYEHPTRIVADSPQALAGLRFRWDLMMKDKVEPTGADSQTINGGTMSMFLDGKLAMFYSGLWKVPTFRDIKNFDWDVAMFPKGPDGTRGFSSGGSGYAMKKGVADPGDCWKLIKFMAGPEAETYMAETGLTQPAIMSLAKSKAFLDGKKPHNKKMLLKAALIATQPPKWYHYDEFMTSVLGPNLDPAWVPGFSGNLADLVKAAVRQGNGRYFPDSKAGQP